jgi:hypothetical protein
VSRSAGRTLARECGGASPHSLYPAPLSPSPSRASRAPPLPRHAAGRGQRAAQLCPRPQLLVGGEVARRSRDGAGDNGAKLGERAAQPPNRGIKLNPSKFYSPAFSTLYHFFAWISHDFTQHPTPLGYITRAALMGPDDHRHSGERAAYGSAGQRCHARAEFPLAMFPLSLPVLEKGPRALSQDKKP